MNIINNIYFIIICKYYVRLQKKYFKYKLKYLKLKGVWINQILILLLLVL